MSKLIDGLGLSKIFSLIKRDYSTPADVKTQILNTETGFGYLERSTSYEVGDVVCKDDLGNGLYLQCIQAGTTGTVEPTEPDTPEP